MQLKPHQKKASKKLSKILLRHGIALLSGEPRSGKTLSFLDCASRLRAGRLLIVTQKAALSDIQNQSNLFTAAPSKTRTSHLKTTIVNFHQVKNLNPNDYDLVVIDEAHRWITGYPKRSTLWNEIRPFCKGKPVIFSSGTLTPEGYSGLFNMLALSDHSPWRQYPRFTLWFEDYGRPYSIRIHGNDIKRYDRTIEEKVLADVEKITVSITREEGGHKFEAVDYPLTIPLSSKQQKFVDKLKKDLVIPKHDILADTPAKMIQKLHQISGGFVKREDGSLYTFKENPKIQYIKDHFDPQTTIILAHHIAEQEALAKIFPHTGSIKKNAEGKDFSHFENMVIFSMDFSAATYEQVRARQLNMDTRHTEVNITYLLSGIDHYIYEAVKSKRNFTASWYAKNAS